MTTEITPSPLARLHAEDAAPSAIVKQQKTGYYVTDADGNSYRDAGGHGWFSKAIAREIAREIGGMYYDGNRTTIKEVVTGYAGGAR